FLKKGKVILIADVLYMYRQRQNSLITTVNEAYYLELIKTSEYALNKYRDLFKKNTKEEKYLKKRAKKHRSSHIYYLIVQNLKDKKFNDAFILMTRNLKVTLQIGKNFSLKRFYILSKQRK
ncbi:hypothetical protein, partial [Xanthovirga aplysinae]|uniref:hypothetical protein n=1 Tax=Xanthovirga aplysinae TaxID=2529853 RepID=UPI0016569CB9